MKKLVVIIFVFFSALYADAQTNTYSGASGGNWGTATNWSLGLVPTITHDVVVPNNIDITVDISAAVCNSLTIQTGANNNRVNVGANTLTVSNNVTINIPTANNIVKQVYVTSGTLNVGSIVMGNSATNTRDCRVVVENGVINVSGNITMGGSSQENQVQILGTGVSGGTLNLAGNFVGSGGDLICTNNSTVRYNGTAAQTVIMNNAFNYNNLIIQNTGTATLSGGITTTRLSGDLTVASGTLNMSTQTIAGNNTATFTMAANTSLRTNAAGANAVPSGFGTFSFSPSSTVIFERAGGQTVRNYASPGYGKIEILGSGNKTAGGNLFVQGDVTVGSGAVFVLSNLTHQLQGKLSNSGTVSATTGTITISQNFENDGVFTGGTTSTLNVLANLINTGTITAGTAASNINISGNYVNSGTFTSGSNGTVTFNGSTTGKTISGTLSGTTGRFNNLTFNGASSEWTVSDDMDVNRVLNVNNGSVFITKNLTAAGAFPITVASNGSLTLENSANILQTAYTGSNSGSIVVKRNSTPIVRDDYTYWSSPTTGTQTLADFSSNSQSDRFYTYDNSWANASVTSSFLPGLGYAIRVPEDVNESIPEVRTFSFTGTPNNGTYTQAVSVGDKLVGNPYPSAINANAFIDANVLGTGTINTTISGKLFFWTHNNRIVGNDYLATDYAFYTKLGGTAVTSGTGNTTAPNGFIASGQGFFVEVLANGNVTFNNAMRVANNNTNFYRPQAMVANNGIDRFWLNLTNNSSNASQTLVGFCSGCSNGTDAGFDATYNGADGFALYSLNGQDKYSIQALAPLTDLDTTIPLGYTINSSGEATITLANTDGIFINEQNIFIEDLLTNTFHNISESAYTFTTEAGTFDDRLRVRFVAAPLNSDDNLQNPQNKLQVFNSGNVVRISNPELWSDVQFFDLSGRRLNTTIVEKETTFESYQINTRNQLVIIKVQLKSGQSLAYKVLAN